jgi:hypothetical protein
MTGSNRLDELSKALAQDRSRRGLLRLLLGGAVGAAGVTVCALAGPREAAAKTGTGCICIWVSGVSHYHCTEGGRTVCYGRCY